MKRDYRGADELGKQRSVRKFQELAEQGASVQLMLPLGGGTADGPGWLWAVVARSWFAFDDVGDGRRS